MRPSGGDGLELTAGIAGRGGRWIRLEASDFLIVLRVVLAAAFWKDLGPYLDPFGIIFWTSIVILSLAPDFTNKSN